jgi:hypothetical protein
MTLEEMISVFPHLVLCWVQVCHTYPLFCWSVFLLFLISSKVYHERVLNFVKGFSESIEMILSFPLFICYITFIDLLMLNHTYIPGMKPTWSWYMILLMCCWIQFANILSRILHLCSSKWLVYFFFLVCACLILVWV